jgi:O-antigen/teichoic acid export membrane protein
MIMLNRLRSPYSEIARIFSWLVYSKHASFAIADQAVISIGSFVLTIVIARKGGMDVLGAFSLILVLSTFGGTVTNSVVNAPAMVLFALRQKNEDEEKYRGFLFAASVVLGAILAIVLSLIYAAYRQRLGVSFSYAELLVIASLFAVMPVSDTLRRAAFARRRGWVGFRISLTRSVPPPIVLYFIFVEAHQLQLFDIVLVVAIANAASVVTELTLERLQLPDCQFALANVRRHWQSSRWLLLSSIFNSGYTDIFTLAAGFIFGDRALAAIRISQQIFGIVVAGMQTFENTLPRQLALLGRESNYRAYRSLVNTLGVMVFCSVGACCGLLWWFGNQLVLYIFQIDYRNYSLLLLFWAGSTVCGGTRSIFATSYRAREYTRPIFAADACSFLVASIIVFPFLYWFGVIGSGAGMLITNMVGLSILLALMPRRE